MWVCIFERRNYINFIWILTFGLIRSGPCEKIHPRDLTSKFWNLAYKNAHIHRKSALEASCSFRVYNHGVIVGGSLFCSLLPQPPTLKVNVSRSHRWVPNFLADQTCLLSTSDNTGIVEQFLLISWFTLYLAHEMSAIWTLLWRCQNREQRTGPSNKQSNQDWNASSLMPSL